MNSDDWQTPWHVLQIARAALGGDFDLDPASVATAQPNVQALQFYSREDDGLALPWVAERVWLNPPYSNPRPWFHRIIEGWASGEIGSAAVLMADRALATRGGSEILDASALIAIPKRRTRFLLPSGEPGDSPPFGVILVVGGSRLGVDTAANALSGFGTVWGRSA